ncbi:DsbA family protein [Brevibacterium album]|uniref:DsbA family protein n=1 Tax=Brevibacterium album TaxID=417948 RepID=UPI0004297102|nr:thioredoxin domain-containing protein [Brevibacterium album]
MANKSSSEERRSAAREQARQIAEAQAKREKTVKVIVYSSIAVVVAAVLVVVGALVWNSTRPTASPQNLASGAFALASDGDGLMAVAPEAAAEEVEASGLPGVEESQTPADAPRVKVYLDFQCPGCAAFEDANAQTVNRLAEEGSIILEYEPVAILDRFSMGNEYSTRSANMVTCLADSGQAAVLPEVFAALFAQQPAEGTEGMSDEDLMGIAEEAGADMGAEVSEAAGEGLTVTECTTEVAFEKYVAAETQTALNDEGLQGTPYITIDGEPYEGDWGNPEAFAADLVRAIG